MKPLNFLSLYSCVTRRHPLGPLTRPQSTSRPILKSAHTVDTVQNVDVYIDGAVLPVCMTDATGDCTVSNIDLAEGLHKARYELLQSSSSPWDPCSWLALRQRPIDAPVAALLTFRPYGSAGSRTTASVSA